MICSSRVSAWLKILGTLAVFCWCLWFSGLTKDYKQVLGGFKDEKARFVDEYLDTEVGVAFDGDAITTLCLNKTWTKDLIFQCEPAPGGIGMVRNAHLNCVRFAIEAGGKPSGDPYDLQDSVSY
jgi:hypothetical protein